jgi:hypothetical protein
LVNLTRFEATAALALLLLSPGVCEAAEAYVIGAGDIARCGNKFLPNAEATAKLLDGFLEPLPESTPAVVITFGDNAYKKGSTEEFANCYGPTWGRHKDRTRPSVGNHEYKTHGAKPYYDYFGETAGDPNEGYYSFDLGDWHLISLNTVCDKTGGCGEGSSQYRWLVEDLQKTDMKCVMAYSHHPLFSSGHHGGDKRVRPLFQALYNAGVELYISGHEHHYERFGPQDPSGNADLERGVRQFIVGTGGRELRRIGRGRPNSELRSRESYGVIRFRLLENRYEWVFIPVEGSSLTDSGEGVCH